MKENGQHMLQPSELGLGDAFDKRVARTRLDECPEEEFRGSVRTRGYQLIIQIKVLFSHQKSKSRANLTKVCEANCSAVLVSLSFLHKWYLVKSPTEQGLSMRTTDGNTRIQDGTKWDKTKRIKKCFRGAMKICLA